MSNDRKKLIILLITIILILTAALVYLNTDLFKESETAQTPISDNIRFYREYLKVPQDNAFKYATVEKIIDVLKSGTGIVFFGFPSCSWCKIYVPVLNEVAVERGIENIYYYNIKEIRENNTAEYLQIVELLKKYLNGDEDGNKRIYVPDTYFVKNGKILAHNNDMCMMSGDNMEEYFTEEKRRELKTSLIEAVEKLYPETCEDSTSSTGC